jgi:RNA polymerase sigma factor (sigma-70 family)
MNLSKNTMKAVQSQVDNELIDRCIKGDEAAWKELVIKYQRLVYSVAHVLCPAGEDVSDIFQQVWLELYQHLPELRNAVALPAWLITVTRRRVYAAIRMRHGSEPLDDDMPDVSQQINQIEHEHMLERALGQMPERCQKLINLLYFEPKEPSYSEIAEALGMPEASIGPTRARCLEKLRKLLG